MFKTIVCAVDESRESELAGETACAIAGSTGASLYFVNVLTEVAPSEEAMDAIASYERAEHVRESPWFIAEEALSAGAKAILDAAIARARSAGVKVEQAVVRDETIER